MACQDPKEMLVKRDYLDFQANQVPWGNLVNLALLDSKAKEVLQGLWDELVKRVAQDYQGRMAAQDCL